MRRQWDVRAIEKVTHGIAKRMRIEPEIAWAVLNSILVDENVEQGAPQAIANSVWAFTTMECSLSVVHVGDRRERLVSGWSRQQTRKILPISFFICNDRRSMSVVNVRD